MKRLLILVLVFSATALFAEKAEKGFYFTQGLALAYNHLGVGAITSLVYRFPLSDSDAILWRSAKIDIGLENVLSPAADGIALYMNIEPIAIFDVTVKAGFDGFFKLFNYGFIELSSYQSEYSDSAITNIAQQDNGLLHVQVTPRLKAAFGPFIFADTFTFQYFWGGSDSRYFLDRVDYLVLKFNDYCFINNVYALFQINEFATAGLNYRLLWQTTSGYNSQYVAGVGGYKFVLSPTMNISVNAVLGLYLTDRYYRMLPYAALKGSLDIKL